MYLYVVRNMLCVEEINNQNESENCISSSKRAQRSTVNPLKVSRCQRGALDPRNRTYPPPPWIEPDFPPISPGVMTSRV